MPRVSIRSIRRPGLGEAPTRSFALQHRGRAELARHHQFGGLQEDVHVVADVGVDVGALAGGLGRGDTVGVLGLGLILTGFDDGVDLFVGDERAPATGAAWTHPSAGTVRRPCR